MTKTEIWVETTGDERTVLVEFPDTEDGLRLARQFAGAYEGELDILVATFEYSGIHLLETVPDKMTPRFEEIVASAESLACTVLSLRAELLTQTQYGNCLIDGAENVLDVFKG